MRRPAAAAIAIAALVSSATASAQEMRPAAVVSYVDGDGPGLDQLLLIGESGQLYLPEPDGWRRRTGGGVAGDVAGAARLSDGTVQVIAGQAPIYEFRGQSWRVHTFGSHGRSRANTASGIPVLSVGRQLYAFERDRWTRIGLAPESVEVLWAGSRSRIYVFTSNGNLFRGDGRRWQNVPHPLPTEDSVAWMVGVSGRSLYAVTAIGDLLEIDTAGARAVSLPETLTGFRPTAGCASGRTAYLAGELPAAAGPSYALVTLDGKSVEVAATLPAPDAGDRYSLCAVSRAGPILLATYGGRVRTRGADGQWVERTVSVDLPPPPAMPELKTRHPALAP